ncbi:hypothetical protein R1flu_026446 [Riccia fluitans]|uniref:Cytochrome P450 n=1 Tax=Riccia fluitans TaxID=41844 RepID=A0ABD1XK14_9MARC
METAVEANAAASTASVATKHCCQHMMESFNTADLLTLQNVLYALLAASLIVILIMELSKPRLKLPPGPKAVPVFGNWLQVGNYLIPEFTGYGEEVRRNIPAKDGGQDMVFILYGDPTASTTGCIVRKRLQLMTYNIMYRMLFDRRFETMDDELFKMVGADRPKASITITGISSLY